MPNDKNKTVQPSPDIEGPDIVFDPDNSDVQNIIDKVSGKEVFKQYADHQPYIISGLDNEEEFKSRMAFVDAYKNEFAEIHAEIKKTYRKKGALNEFDYLRDTTFRKNAGMKPGRDNTIFLMDMMKDYMTYLHVKGEVSTILFNSFLSKERKAELKFRNQTLSKKDREFLIDESSFSEEKKTGIRECRKWMYRNCGKSGMFNETGSKRCYIDLFAKKPVTIQANTLYQIEKGLYKYDDNPGLNEKIAVSNNYVPKLSGLIDKMKRTKLNPYSYYKKATGDYFYWTRMERALKKSEARSDLINSQYKENFALEKLNAPIGEKKNEEGVQIEAGSRIQLKNHVAEAQEIKRIKSVYGEFVKERDSYLSCLRKYQDDRSDKNYADVLRQGTQLQRLVKNPANMDVFERIDNINGEKKPISSAIQLTTAVQKNRKMDDKTIDRMVGEKIVDKVDLGITIKGLVDKGYSVGSGVAGAMKAGEKTLEKVSRFGAFATAIVSAYTSVKAGLMSLISWGRKKKAEKIQKQNIENQDILANGEDAESRRIKDIAKVSKKRNNEKIKSYASEGAFAAAGVGFTVLGLVGVVGMPITVAGGIVAAAGFAIKYTLDYYTRKKTASKAIDRFAKTEEELSKEDNAFAKAPKRGYVPDHKKYIDEKVEDQLRILDDKKMRFQDGESARKVMDVYLEDRTQEKLKDRVREKWAVDKGNISIYSCCDSLDHENVMDAYRHMFLKNPEGPLDENNLLTPKQVKQYMSTDDKDLEATNQTIEQARKRAMYKDLMKTEGVQTKAPKNLKEAKKRFTAKPQAPENAEKTNDKTL